jgi:hypothetical protein
MEQARQELEPEVYPDSAQKELSGKYHRVALTYFAQLVEKSKLAGRNLTPQFSQGLERMYACLACTIRPDGYGMLNNDSDLDYNADTLKTAADTWFVYSTGG